MVYFLFHANYGDFFDIFNHTNLRRSSAIYFWVCIICTVFVVWSIVVQLCSIYGRNVFEFYSDKPCFDNGFFCYFFHGLSGGKSALESTNVDYAYSGYITGNEYYSYVGGGKNWMVIVSG